ncbi:MAG: hypothetical protein ACE5I5_02690 [Candidatus Heimdallarchaeota archaeon]
MPSEAHLKCQNCDFAFKLRTHQDCWVDEDGNVGILAQPGPKVIGEPKGKFQTGFYDNKYCVTCGKVYSVLRMDVTPPRFKRVQKDKTTILSDAEMACLQCETILLDFLGVLEISKNRERAFRVVFKRVYVSKREILSCPKCKEGKIELTSYNRI